LAPNPLLYVGAHLALIVICIWAADRHAADIGLKDPSVVVCDEIAGMAVAAAFLPLTAATLLAAFLLFRFFDVLKPPPIRQAEQLPGGLGIVADDLLAGLVANLVLRALLAWRPELADLSVW
jgi:phosphatidylglycerophosphatase A